MNIFLYLHSIAEYVTNFVNVVKRANCFKEKKKTQQLKHIKNSTNGFGKLLTTNILLLYSIPGSKFNYKITWFKCNTKKQTENNANKTTTTKEYEEIIYKNKRTKIKTMLRT